MDFAEFFLKFDRFLETFIFLKNYLSYLRLKFRSKVAVARFFLAEAVTPYFFKRRKIKF